MSLHMPTLMPAHMSIHTSVLASPLVSHVVDTRIPIAGALTTLTLDGREIGSVVSKNETFTCPALQPPAQHHESLDRDAVLRLGAMADEQGRTTGLIDGAIARVGVFSVALSGQQLAMLAAEVSSCP